MQWAHCLLRVGKVAVATVLAAKVPCRQGDKQEARQAGGGPGWGTGGYAGVVQGWGGLCASRKPRVAHLCAHALQHGHLREVGVDDGEEHVQQVVRGGASPERLPPTTQAAAPAEQHAALQRCDADTTKKLIGILAKGLGVGMLLSKRFSWHPGAEQQGRVPRACWQRPPARRRPPLPPFWQGRKAATSPGSAGAMGPTA